MSNFGEGDVLVVNGVRYYQGGTVLGDLVITGDLEVQGGGSFTYDEIVNGTLEVTTSITTPAITGDDGLSLSASTARAAVSGELILYSPDGTDFIEVRNSVLEFNTNGTRRFFVSDSSVGVVNAMPLVFFVTDGGTEGSRFTQAAGSTTWAGTATSDLLITANSAKGISIGGAAAIAGRVFVGSPDGTDHLEVLNGRISINTNSLTRLNVLDGSVSIWAGIPLIFYSDGGSTEEGRITAAANQLIISGTGGGDVRIHNDQGNLGLYIAATANGVAVLTSDGTGNATVRSSDTTDYFSMSTTRGQIARNNVVLMDFTDSNISVWNNSTLNFYSDTGSTLQATITSGASILTIHAAQAGGDIKIESDDSADFLLVEAGNIEIDMNNQEVQAWADTYEVHRQLGAGEAANSYWQAWEFVITDGSAIAAGDGVVWDASAPGRVITATAGANPVGYCAVGGTGDTAGAVKAVVVVQGYIAALTADTAGVTQFQYLIPGATTPATKWASQATIEGSAGLVLAAATDGNTFPAWIFGPR